MPAHAECHHHRHGASQHSGKCRGLSIAGQKVGEHGHHEDAEPESADPLDKTAHAAHSKKYANYCKFHSLCYLGICAGTPLHHKFS